jgi:hypothetical protein
MATRKTTGKASAPKTKASPKSGQNDKTDDVRDFVFDFHNRFKPIKKLVTEWLASCPEGERELLLWSLEGLATRLRVKEQEKPGQKTADVHQSFKKESLHIYFYQNDLKRDIPLEGWKVEVEDRPQYIELLKKSCSDLWYFLDEMEKKAKRSTEVEAKRTSDEAGEIAQMIAAPRKTNGDAGGS